MGDKPKPIQIQKQDLSITHYEMDVPYSQGSKYLDRARVINLSLEDGHPLAGKELRMTIFNQDLKTFVRGKSHIVADVEERERDNSDYGPDRTIVQVYDDKGEAVSRKKGGGGGWNNRRPLEDDLALEAVKRRSIEGQTAIAQVGNLLSSEHEIPGEALGVDPETLKRILALYWEAIEKSLVNYLEGPIMPKHRATNPDQRGQATKPGAESTGKATDEKANGSPLKHVGQLLTKAHNQFKINPAQVGEILGVEKLTDITDLEGAWKQIKKSQAKAA